MSSIPFWQPLPGPPQLITKPTGHLMAHTHTNYHMIVCVVIHLCKTKFAVKVQLVTPLTAKMKGDGIEDI